MKYLFFLLLLPCWCGAQVLAENRIANTTSINGDTYWLESTPESDPGISGLFDQPNHPGFKKGSRYQEFFNRLQHPVYGRFHIRGNQYSMVYLVVDNANIDSLEVWYKVEGQVRRMLLGSGMPSLAGMPQSTKFLIPLVYDGSTQEVLLRARTRKTLILPLLLVRPTALHAFLFLQNAPELIMLGMVTMLMLYYLMRVIWTRSRQELWYMLYLASLICYGFLYLRGYSHFLGLPLQGFVTDNGASMGALAYLCAMFFAWHYLDRSRAPRWFLRGYRWSMTFPLVTIAADLMNQHQFTYNLLLAQGLLVPCLMLSFGLQVYRKGDWVTLYFLGGWTFVSLSVITNALLVMKVLDPSLKHIPQLLLAATCLEMLSLSLGLGYKQSLLRKEKIALQGKMLFLLQNQKQELEQQVALRTTELQQSLQKMEESNAIKARLLAIISHDLRMPFVSLNAALDLLSLNILSPQKAQQKLATIKSSIKNIAGTLENLLTWSKMQQQKIATQPEALPFKAFCKETSSLLQATIESKQIRLETDIQPGALVLADRFQLETILRNLLSNAIKASPPSSVIRIGCQPTSQEEGQYCITIDDEGPGIQEPSLAAWLKQQTGIPGGGNLANGLGFQICHEFLALHNSVLNYHHHGKGSTFSFILPAAAAVMVHEKAPQEILQG